MHVSKVAHYALIGVVSANSAYLHTSSLIVLACSNAPTATTESTSSAKSVSVHVSLAPMHLSVLPAYRTSLTRRQVLVLGSLCAPTDTSQTSIHYNVCHVQPLV